MNLTKNFKKKLIKSVSNPNNESGNHYNKVSFSLIEGLKEIPLRSLELCIIGSPLGGTFYAHTLFELIYHLISIY